MQGSCLCGGVRFEIPDTKLNLYQCHCSVCRKSTGSAANASTLVEAKNFNWLEIKTDIHSFSLESGYRVDFCSRCGSSVPNELRGKGLFWVPAGLLEEGDLTVTQHIFVGSKAHWDIIGGSAKQHDKIPSLDELIELLKT